MTREEFIMTARSFIGTPFMHQGRLPGTALDCAGVVVCAAQACGHGVRDQTGYADVPHAGLFVAAVEEHAERIDLAAVRPGDLMIFAFAREPQHVAIVTQTDPLQIVHAWADAGRVVENGFDAYWRRRLRGCYRLQGVL
jgi:cell wall-associated NlpC family hydrolase